jgi:hypothetical protein
MNNEFCITIGALHAGDRNGYRDREQISTRRVDEKKRGLRCGRGCGRPVV